MTTGILVQVYTSGTDCTNNGLSSKENQLIMVGQNGEDFDCPHTTESDYLVLIKETFFKGSPNETETLKAVPKSLLDAGKRPMFGGNFCYTSDSRFPNNAPIKIFDRIED